MASTNPSEFDQTEMLHELPQARVVDRIEFLTTLAAGRRVIHVGFADAGCRSMQAEHGTWLHAILAETASELVGLDVENAGVQAAIDAGYEAYLLDCTDPEALAAAAIEPADLVLAGEVIEHVPNPGGFIEGLRSLCRPGGQVVITTPNASGWANSIAAMAGKEVNHPDHIVMFSWRTLSSLMERSGLYVEQSATYVPTVKADGAAGGASLLAARGIAFLERAVGRFAPFVADGLIVIGRKV